MTWICAGSLPRCSRWLGPLLCWDNWSFTSWKFLPTHSRLPRQPALPKCYGTLLLLTNHESASPICFTRPPVSALIIPPVSGCVPPLFPTVLHPSVGLIVRLRPSFPVLSASAYSWRFYPSESISRASSLAFPSRISAPRSPTETFVALTLIKRNNATREEEPPHKHGEGLKLMLINQRNIQRYGIHFPRASALRVLVLLHTSVLVYRNLR